MQVQHLREVNQAQGRQLASARAHMEAQAVAAAAQHQQAGFRLCFSHCVPCVRMKYPQFPAYNGMGSVSAIDVCCKLVLSAWQDNYVQADSLVSAMWQV